MTDRTTAPVKVGFVLHVMQVAGAEVLVAETIRRLGDRIEPVVLCLDDIGPLGEALQRSGVPVVRFGRRPGLDIGLTRRLAAEMQARQLDVVHAHQYTPFFYTALARLQIRHPPRILFTEHGRHYPDVVSRRRRLTNRFLLRHLADEIHGVCRFSADSLADIDGFSGHIDVIPNGIDLSRYTAVSKEDARRRLNLPLDRQFITCVARFHPVKDHATLLRGFARVVRASPTVDLLLAGDGPLRATLEAQATALGIEGRVRFLGVRDDVPDLLRASDVFALTSISEAASLTLLEAMACRVPVVVTAVGGNPEIVEADKHGFLVPRGDDAALARAVLYLLEHPACAASMGSAGFERVRDHYRIEQTIDTYYQRYRSTAATRHSAARG